MLEQLSALCVLAAMGRSRKQQGPAAPGQRGSVQSETVVFLLFRLSPFSCTLLRRLEV